MQVSVREGPSGQGLVGGRPRTWHGGEGTAPDLEPDQPGRKAELAGSKLGDPARVTPPLEAPVCTSVHESRCRFCQAALRTEVTL